MKNMKNILQSNIFNNDEFVDARNKIINMMEATPHLWNAFVATCEEHNVTEDIMLMWIDKCIYGAWTGCSVEESDRRILTDCIKWYSGNMRKTWTKNLNKQNATIIKL